jgi:halocyanin-like protein
MTDSTGATTRRRFLRAGALLGLAGTAGCAGGSGGGTGGGADDGDASDGTGDGSGSGDGDGGAATDDSYDAWLDGVPNYDGTPADRTGAESVTVVVGAGNGLLFDPPAVRVSPGTTVVWEWTGRGGQHNVRAEDGAFESKLFTTEGSTFEWTFESPGVVRYLCVPHQAVGMKGVVDVVDG